MRKEIFASIAVVGVVATVAVFAISQFAPQSTNLVSTDSDYAQYMAKYGKSYGTKEEYLYRRELYSSALSAISASNSQNGVTYQLALNKFADMTEYERSRYLGDLQTAEETSTVSNDINGASSPIDWRDKGVVNAVKDQGSCGGCWSFSTIGPTEEHYAIKYGSLVQLSEQQLVDCSGSYGNSGCNGGLFKYGYAYLQAQGAESASSYPYTAVDGTCAYDASKVIVKTTGAVSVGQDPDSLKAALSVGPVSISLYASSNSFYYYSSGILNDLTCPTSPNHAVHTVGWGSENGLDYFIVRNSWGASWGEKGYIRMAVTTQKLGICGMFYRVPMYPIIA